MIGRHKEHEFGKGFGINRAGLMLGKEALRFTYELPNFISRPDVAKGGPPERPLPPLAVDSAQAESLHAIITVAALALDFGQRVSEIIGQPLKREFEPIQGRHPNFSGANHDGRSPVVPNKF